MARLIFWPAALLTGSTFFATLAKHTSSHTRNRSSVIVHLLLRICVLRFSDSPFEDTAEETEHKAMM